MTATRVRFGIVGTGGIANTHAAGLAALADDAELVACCDVAPDRVANFAERWGVRHQYDSARAMLDAGQIDVVCVCTPHPQHAEPLILAAERGIHGVVEKPFTATLAEADRVVEAATKYGTMLSTMAQRRWFPAAQRVRQAIDTGKLGSHVLLGESFCEMWRDEAYYARDAWRGRWDTEGGGVLMNQAPHNIDFLLWYMGPAEEIFGYWANLNHPYVEIEDNAVAVIRFRSGALGILKGTVSMNPERRHPRRDAGRRVGADRQPGLLAGEGRRASDRDRPVGRGQQRHLDDRRPAGAAGLERKRRSNTTRAAYPTFTRTSCATSSPPSAKSAPQPSPAKTAAASSPSSRASTNRAARDSQ